MPHPIPPADECPSEFGITLADAHRLAHKADRIQITFKIGTDELGDDMRAIFDLPADVIDREIRIHGVDTIRPCELCFNKVIGATLLFGGPCALKRAELARYAAKVAAEASKATAS